MPHADDTRPPQLAPSWERLAANVVRSLHLAAVVAMGAALLGAPGLGSGFASLPAWAVLTTGAVLLAMDLVAGRVHLAQAAGAMVLLKLAALLLAALQPPWAGPIFLAVLVLSSLTAHAPKAWRHRRVWPRLGPPA